MKSIFELENRLNIQHEFSKFIKILHKNYEVQDRLTYKWMSFMDAVEEKIFRKWKYRDTFLTVNEYLEFIGITNEVYNEKEEISKEAFLYYIEFILNMLKVISEDYNFFQYDEKTMVIIKNIPIILEKMNYKSKRVGDRMIITKRNADVDVVLDSVNENIASTLLEYNDFRIKEDIGAKGKILKQLDLYIEKNIKIKSFDKELDNAIGTIVNNMGVNHPIKEEPYISLSEKQIIEWYDKCFIMIIHAIREVEVNKIKNERKKLLNSY